MEVRVLRYFIEVVQEGNISNAAKHLHISQPTLSRQLMDLEDELGIKLFVRGHRQIQLTPEGYYLYERAQEITSLVAKTTTNLQSQKIVSGTIDIGAGESPALAIIMETLAKILKDHHNIKVNLVSGDSNFINQGLDNGSLDFGIVMGPERLTNFYSLPLPHKNKWGVLIPKDNKLAKKESIRPTDLLNQPLLVSQQAQHQDVFRTWAGELLHQFDFIGHYNLVFNAKLLAQTGSCLVLTYENLINLRDTDLVFRPLEPTISDQNTLIWNKNHQLSNVAQLFLRILKKKLK